MGTKHRRPIESGLFTWPAEEPRLIGSECAGCGVVTFPQQSDCPRCHGADMRETTFARQGTLWTFTTQEFVPKSPPYARQEDEASFRPYAVGYVEFPGQARVEGRIDTADLSSLRIGMLMEVVVVPFMDDEDGNEIVTYAFRPVAGQPA